MASKASISKKKLKEAKELAGELLSLMGTEAKVEVSEDKENEAIKIDIESEDEKGLLIGRRGETINSIQVVLGIMLQQKLGEWTRTIVNIGDWRVRQEEQLRNLAEQAAERAIETGEPQSLYNLNAQQRRIVHLALVDNPDIETESLGEGRDRYLVVSLKEKKS